MSYENMSFENRFIEFPKSDNWVNQQLASVRDEFVGKQVREISDKRIVDYFNNMSGTVVNAQDVIFLQIALARLGYDPGVIDGVYKNKDATISRTIDAVRAFQTDNGLVAEGQAGKDTISKIIELLSNNVIHEVDGENGLQEEYSRGEYVNGEKQGLWKTFYKNGTLKSEGKYVNGEWQGVWKYYYKNGKLESEGEYVNGDRQGLWKEYYENGQLRSERNFVDGFLQGPWKEYYENGQLSFEGGVVNSLNQGLSKTFYKNGKLESEGEYVNGDRQGLWKEYYENGQLRSERNFVDGFLQGLWKEYYENGQLRSERNFVDGFLQGPWKEYYENGKLESEGEYGNGEYYQSLPEFPQPAHP